jgi:hypothetical protein
MIVKKTRIVLALLIIGSNVFAQTFSLGEHLATDFENVWPTFDAGINLSHVDILAGVSFWIYQNEFSYDNYLAFNIDGKYEERWYGRICVIGCELRGRL